MNPSQLSKTPAICIMLFSVLQLMLTATATAGPPPSQDLDWAIEQDTRLVDQEKQIQGDLAILGNATLTLEGTHLQLGGRLLVGPNATLVLASSSTGPSSISAIPGDHAFWMKVQGEMRTEGTGPHVIEGLDGVGLASAFSEGGLRIEGQAHLRDVHVRDGLAGVIVMPEGVLDLREAVVSALGDVGLMVLGTMHLEDAVLEQNNMGIIGRAPCDVTVVNAGISSTGTNLFVNGCSVQVTDSVLNGGYASIGANNEAILEVRSSLLRNYTQEGLSSYAYPDVEGGMSRPTVRLHDVSFDPDPQAQRGMELRGLSLAEFVNVTLQGHKEHGIQAQTTALFIQDSTIQGNGGPDIELAGGHFLNDPLASGNRFGSIPNDEADEKGAISHFIIARLSVVDESETLIPGEVMLNVYRLETGEPLEIFPTEDGASGTIRIMFQAFGTDSKGNPEYLGPFGYEATHPAGAAPWTGTLHPENGTILLFLAQDAMEAESLPANLPGALFVMLVAAVLVAIGVRPRPHR